MPGPNVPPKDLQAQIEELTLKVAELEKVRDDRTRMVRALVEGRQKESVVLDNIAELVVYLDRSLRVVWANRSARESVGRSAEELIGKFCFEIWHQRSLPCVVCPCQDALKTSQPQIGEVTSPDGRNWLIKGYPLLDEQGALEGVIEVTQDLTGQKQHFHRLFESETFLRSILQSLNDIVFAFDEQKRFVFVHGKKEDLFLPSEEFLGKKHSEVLPGHVNQLFEEAFEQVRRFAHAHFDYPLTMGGRTRWYSTTLSPIMGQGVFKGAVAVVREITSLKESESQLRQALGEWQRTFDSISDIAFVQDADFTIVKANQACAVALNKSLLEIIGKKCYELFHGAQEPVLQCPFERTRFDRKPHTAEIIDPSFKVPLLVTTSPLFDEKGEFLGSVHIAKDISSLKAVERALRESQERYRCIVETANEGIWMVDAAFCTSFVNERLTQMLGFSPQEMFGKRVDSFMPPEEIPDHAQKMQARRQGKKQAYERRFLRKDGGVVWFLVSASPFFDEQGSFAGSFAMCTDITETKAARQDQENLFSLTQDMFCVVTMDGFFTMLNPAWERILGWSMQELREKPFMEFVYPDDRAATEQQMGVLREGQRVTMFANRYRCKDGTLRWLSWNSSPVCGNNRIYAVARDITSLKKMEDELRVNEERFRSLVINLPGIVYRCACEENWTMSYMSEASRQLTGYPVSDFIGNAVRSYASVIHPEDRREVERVVFEAVSRQEAYEMQYRLIAADGQVKWVWERGQGIAEVDGQVRELEGLILDVTERRRQDAALQEFQEQFRTIVNCAQDAIFIKDGSLRYTLVNGAMEKALGRSQQELLGRTDDDFFEEKDAQHILGTDRRVLQGEVISQEHAVLLGGQQRTFHVVKVPIRGSEGAITGICGIARDVTERRMQEEENTRRAEQSLRFQAALLELSRMSFQDTQKALSAVTEAVSDAVEIERVSMWFFDQEHRRLMCRDLFLRSKRQHLQEEPLDLARLPVYAAALEKEHSLVAEDVSGLPVFQELLEGYLKPLGIISMLDVPIRLHGALVGVMCLEHPGPVHHWTAQEQEFAFAVSEFVALILEAEQRRTLEISAVTAERRYQLLVEQMPAVIYTAAIDAMSSTLFISPQVEQSLGFSAADFEKEPQLWKKQLHPDDSARVIQELDAFHQKGGLFQCEYRMVHKSGTVVWFRDEAKIISDTDAKPLYAQGVMFDITERKKTEEDLRKKITELELLGRVAIDRELKMVELKKQVAELQQRSVDAGSSHP